MVGETETLTPVNEAEARQIQAALSVFQRFRGLPQFEWLQEVLPKMQNVFGLHQHAEPIFQFEHNMYLKGIEYIEILYQHILKKEVLAITFQDFKKANVAVYTLHPYLLKQYNKRWFLVSLNHDNQRIWITPMDRIEQVIALDDISYQPNDMDLEEYFDDIIGVTRHSNEPLEKIRLKIFEPSVPYVLTKPFHASQRHIETKDHSTIIELKLRWNFELEALILSFGDHIEVLSPLSLRQKIADRIKRQSLFYVND